MFAYVCVQSPAVKIALPSGSAKPVHYLSALLPPKPNLRPSLGTTLNCDARMLILQQLTMQSAFGDSMPPQRAVNMPRLPTCDPKGPACPMWGRQVELEHLLTCSSLCQWETKRAQFSYSGGGAEPLVFVIS